MTEPPKERSSSISSLNLVSSRRKVHRQHAARKGKNSKRRGRHKSKSSASKQRKKKLDKSTAQRKESKEERKASYEDKRSVRGNIMAASMKIRKTLMKSVKSTVAKKPDSPADNLSPTQYEEVEKDDEEKEDERKVLEEEREREFAEAKKDCDKARAMESEYTLFERTAAPTRPAVVIEPPLNITCDGKPINTVRVESMPMNSISQQTTLFFAGIDKSPKGDLSLVVGSNPGAQG